MAGLYLDRIGLSHFLEKLKSAFVGKENDKVLSDNNFTDEDKRKLEGLAKVATSGSYDDLTEKPFYDEEKVIEWDGEKEGKTAVTLFGMSTPSYGMKIEVVKVGDVPYFIADKYSTVDVVGTGDATSENSVPIEVMHQDENGATYQFEGDGSTAFVVIAFESVDVDNPYKPPMEPSAQNSITEPGIYFSNIEVTQSGATSSRAYVSRFNARITHKIPARFMPETGIDAKSILFSDGQNLQDTFVRHEGLSTYDIGNALSPNGTPPYNSDIVKSYLDWDGLRYLLGELDGRYVNEEDSPTEIINSEIEECFKDEPQIYPDGRSHYLDIGGLATLVVKIKEYLAAQYPQDTIINHDALANSYIDTALTTFGEEPPETLPVTKFYLDWKGLQYLVQELDSRYKFTFSAKNYFETISTSDINGVFKGEEVTYPDNKMRYLDAHGLSTVVDKIKEYLTTQLGEIENGSY